MFENLDKKLSQSLRNNQIEAQARETAKGVVTAIREGIIPHDEVNKFIKTLKAEGPTDFGKEVMETMTSKAYVCAQIKGGFYSLKHVEPPVS
jgi:hypothetical protein